MASLKYIVICSLIIMMILTNHYTESVQDKPEGVESECHKNMAKHMAEHRARHDHGSKAGHDHGSEAGHVHGQKEHHPSGLFNSGPPRKIDISS